MLAREIVLQGGKEWTLKRHLTVKTLEAVKKSQTHNL
jgi:hypothetical protein